MNRQYENFYLGTRYEYATTLALSSIASAIQVPRPEDYGFDHICTLTEKIGNNRYPRISFGVQVKSSNFNNINFGGVDEDGVQHDWEVQWLFNRDLPLLFATVELDPFFCLKFFSAWSLWHAYWMLPDHYDRSINISINKPPELPATSIDRWKSYPHGIDDNDNYKECTVYLGHPVCEMKSPNPNLEESKQLYDCLNFWITLESLNIQYRKLGIPVMYTVQEWETNIKPNYSPYQYKFTPAHDERGKYLRLIAPIIDSLQDTLNKQNDYESIGKLKGINEIIEENGFSLKPIGQIEFLLFKK